MTQTSNDIDMKLDQLLNLTGETWHRQNKGTIFATNADFLQKKKIKKKMLISVKL